MQIFKSVKKGQGKYFSQLEGPPPRFAEISENKGSNGSRVKSPQKRSVVWMCADNAPLFDILLIAEAAALQVKEGGRTDRQAE